MKRLAPLGAACVAWILGAAILMGLAWPLANVESVSTAAMWSLEHWWAAYAFGLVVLLIAAGVLKVSPTRSLTAYVLPAALLSLIAFVCVFLYPDPSFKDELLGFLPVSAIFFLFGFLWSRLRKVEAGSFARAIVPPIVGGLIILGFVAVPAFTSNAFRYRDAFGLKVSKVNFDGSSLLASGELEIKKAGEYEFAAPQFQNIYSMLISEEPEAMTPGAITWGAAGKPGGGVTGKFPVEIRWNNLPKESGDFAKMASEEFLLSIYLEVRAPENPGEVLTTISAHLPPSALKND